MDMIFAMLSTGAAGDLACGVGHVHDMHRPTPSQALLLVRRQGVVDGHDSGRQRYLSAARQSQHPVPHGASLEQNQRRPGAALGVATVAEQPFVAFGDVRQQPFVGFRFSRDRFVGLVGQNS